MIVVAIVLLATISYPVWLPKATLSVNGQVSITIHITPSKSNYDSGEQVTVSGALTCSGMCPMAALPYPDMDIDLSSSWGWSTTVITSASGAYSATLTLPTLQGTYQITATFEGNSISTTATVGGTPIPESNMMPLALLLSLSCLLLVTKRYSGRVLIVRG